MVSLSTHQARQNFSELLERAFYQNAKIRIERNKKPMAWIVGNPFMEALDQVIDQLIDTNPALADSLALTLDSSIRDIIKRGHKERKARKFVPIETIFNDEMNTERKN